MRKYGKTVKDGGAYSIVEVYDEQSDGTRTLLGYAILNADGDEVGFFAFLDEAIEEMDRLIDDIQPSTPSFDM